MAEDRFLERKNLICELLGDKRYVPMKEKELAIFLQVAPEDRPALKQVLDSLLEEGRIAITKRGRYVLPKDSFLTGIFTGNAKGFGFVAVEGEEQDFFVPEDRVHDALHGDTVRIRLLPGRRGVRPEAEVTEVLARALTQVVGVYQQSKNFGFVIPDNTRLSTDIFIPKEYTCGAVEGHKVVAQITDYGKGHKNPEGKIIEILGHVNDPGVDILSIVRSFGLPEAFPERVVNQANRAAGDGRLKEADYAGRRDLRDMVMVTIDGEDAKDLDDAVSLTYTDGIYHLGVHIADVSNYVQENSALDWEAEERGTSVYLVDRVIPMLPHVLSNGICSLNAGEDRLALSCLMDIDQKGDVVNYEIAETVICVNKRMSYNGVKAVLEEGAAAQDAAVRDAAVQKAAGQDTAVIQPDTAKTDLSDTGTLAYADYAPYLSMLEQMAALSAILRKKRRERGAVDFDFPESKILLDREGNPLEILPYERNVATKLIEDFMLAANETVAQHFYWLELPFVYRSHENPDPDKMQELGLFIHNFGYHIRLGSKKSMGRQAQSYEIHPKELQKLLDMVEGTPQEAMISRLTLRSMKRASYTVDCSGHFGLATQYYCHFTSPIRRYPDLQIHRIIKEFLRGRLKEGRIDHYREILPAVAEHASKMERRADEAERETDKLKKVQYMERHVGEIFTGVISGVTGWGLYVELPNTVEGLLHVSSLRGDYFYYDESRYELVGQMTGRAYKLGQQITVKVAFADRFMRSIDFVMPEEWEYGERDTEIGGEQ